MKRTVLQQRTSYIVDLYGGPGSPLIGYVQISCQIQLTCPTLCPCPPQSSLWHGPFQSALLSSYRLRSAFIPLPSGWEAQLPEQYKSIISEAEEEEEIGCSEQEHKEAENRRPSRANEIETTLPAIVKASLTFLFTSRPQ